MIVYTPLWETMKRKNVTTYTLINKCGMSSHTVHRLRHNMGISTQLINDLCRLLECRVEDILLYLPDEEVSPPDGDKTSPKDSKAPQNRGKASPDEDRASPDGGKTPRGSNKAPPEEDKVPQP